MRFFRTIRNLFATVLLLGIACSTAGCAAWQAAGEWSHNEQKKWSDALSPLVEPDAQAVTSRGREISGHLSAAHGSVPAIPKRIGE